MHSLRVWMKQYSFEAFFVLTMVFSWWPWLLWIQGNESLGVPILPLGPMLAALIVVSLADGWTGLKNVIRRSFRWRLGLRWYAVAIAFPIVLTAVPTGVNILLGSSASTAAWPTSMTAYLGVIAEFLIFVALGEEMGFSAFALPRLLRSRSILATVIILGLTRIIWHLPLFTTGGTEWPVALLLIPTQFIFTWIFIRSQGSALPLILAHLSIGTIGNTFFTSMFTGPDLTRVASLQAAAFVIAAVLLLRATDFMRTGSLLPDTIVEGDVQPVAVSS